MTPEGIAQYEIRLILYMFLYIQYIVIDLNQDLISNENILQHVHAFSNVFMDTKNCQTHTNIFCTGSGIVKHYALFRTSL